MLKDIVIANKAYVKIDISEKIAIDEIAMNVIKYETPDFLLPIKAININGEAEIRYEIGQGIRLSYLPEKMTKNEMMILLENMIRPLKECNDWFLDYHKFYLNEEYIIVEKNYTDIRYMYRFEESYYQSEEDILEFFGDFILKINLSDDPKCTLNLYRKTKEKSTTLMSLLDDIMWEKQVTENKVIIESEKETGKKKSVDSIEIKENISNSWESKKAEIGNEKEEINKVKEVEIHKISDEFGKDDVKESLISNLFGDESNNNSKKENKKREKRIKEREVSKEQTKEKSGKGFFGSLFGGKNNGSSKAEGKKMQGEAEKISDFSYKKNERNFENGQNAYCDYDVVDDSTVTEDLVISESSDSKLMLQLEADHGFHCPKYIEIDLTKGYATIGRYDKAGNAQADYNFESSLSFISRRHCRVEKKEGKIVVIDLGSANGTLINDVALAANMPWQLTKGDRIIFSKNNRITYRIC